MYMAADGTITLCGAYSNMWGILVDPNPGASSGNVFQSGDPCTIRVMGVSKGLLGDVVNAGDMLETRAGGTFGTQSGTHPIVGMALRGGIAGDIIPIDLQARGGPSMGVVAAPPGVMEYKVNLGDVTTNGDIVVGVPLETAGHVIDMYAMVETVDNLTGKTADFYVKIGTTAVTGAVVTVSSALATPRYNIIASAGAASANNAFIAGNTLRISAKNVTSFSGSNGIIKLYVITSA
jgi:hypothetical protein